MRTPFHLKLQMMWGDAAFASFVAHSLIDQLLHPLDQLRSSQPSPGIDRAPKLAIDNIANPLESAPQKSLGQRFLALLFGWRFLVFSHVTLIRWPLVAGC